MGKTESLPQIAKKKDRIEVCIKYNHEYERPYSAGMMGTMIRTKGGDLRMKPYPL